MSAVWMIERQEAGGPWRPHSIGSRHSESVAKLVVEQLAKTHSGHAFRVVPYQKADATPANAHIEAIAEDAQGFVDHGLEPGHFPEEDQIVRAHEALDEHPSGSCEAGSIVALLGMAISRMERLGFTPEQMTVLFGLVLRSWIEEGGLAAAYRKLDVPEEDGEELN